VSVTGKALWYIESHLSGDLSLDAIAAVAEVSRFHLSRAFPASTGYSLYGYIRARRLSEAARILAGGARDILAVALDAGYGSHEAFTRAFHQHFGITPEQFRAAADRNHPSLMEPIRMDQATTSTLAPPRVVTGSAMLIFGLSQRYHCANKAGIPSQWDRFLPHMGTARVAYGVVYNSDDAGNFEYLCGVQVQEFPSHPAEFTRFRIPPQTYAVFEHRDHISSIAATLKQIWDEALPASGHKAADGPLLERYGPEFDGHTGFGGLEIWIPIRS